MTRRRPRRPLPRGASPHPSLAHRPGRRATAVVFLVLALAGGAACSNTGLAGKVTTTTAPEKGTTTAPTTSAGATDPGPSTPGSPGSPGASSGGGGSGGLGGAGANQPDGFVVFQNLETPSTLWTVHADGTAKKQLPPVSGQVLTAPLLSPDGSRLAFVATPIVAGPDPSRPTQPKLWISRSDGTDAHPLTTAVSVDTCAAWSPDGSRLLSSTLDPTTGKTVSRLLAVPASPPAASVPGPPAPPHAPSTTTTTTTTPPSTAVPPAPTPVPIDAAGLVCPVFVDASTLAYATASSPPADTTAPPTTSTPTAPSTTTPTAPAKADTIVSVHLDGTPADTLTGIPGCDVTDVRVAPAGGLVAFSARCDDATASGLYLVGADKQPSVVVPASSGAFAWSPDAAWLAYRRTDPANPLASTEILIAHSNGADARRLIGPANQAPTWGPLPSGGASDRRV